MGVHGQHGRGHHLTDRELVRLRELILEGFTNDQCARAIKCSDRIVSKYRNAWFPWRGPGQRQDANNSRYVAKPSADLSKPIGVQPHMGLGITLEMLTGGKARPAKLRPSE